MRVTQRRVFVMGLFSAVLLISKPKDLDPRLREVRKVFVKGISEPAERAREALTKNSCLALAENSDSADGVLEIASDAASAGGRMGGLGARNWLVSATLTLKSGDLIWSRSTRQTDAPFMGGGKTSGKLLVAYLAKDVGCK